MCRVDSEASTGQAHGENSSLPRRRRCANKVFSRAKEKHNAVPTLRGFGLLGS